MSNIIQIPSLFDMHVHLRDPGFTHKEDIISGSKAASQGGFSGVACMPNTNPPVDNPDVVKYILEKAKQADFKVFPVACITKGMQGEELTDFKALKAAGAVAVSDDGKPVESKELMERALVEAFKSGLPVISHCEDLAIINGGIINEGEISKSLSVKGMNRLSEDSITAREVALAYKTNTRIHIAHVSTGGSVEIIRNAKSNGVKVTCETCPHYFMLNEHELLKKDADYRMNPPLRTKNDVKAIINGIQDGTIDCIVTDHAPHSVEEKADFLTAPNGVVGLETSLAATLTALYHTGLVPLNRIIQLMSFNPRRILGLPDPEEFITVDLDEEWTVEPEKFQSKARNSCFKGLTLKGKVLHEGDF
ncbi:MAG: dihydroorotase [Oscillospiraceae bacterium]|jgi:dihydroorotase|nr:dihydroorotase [Oscillospiraceae bacterium]